MRAQTQNHPSCPEAYPIWPDSPHSGRMSKEDSISRTRISARARKKTTTMKMCSRNAVASSRHRRISHRYISVSNSVHSTPSRRSVVIIWLATFRPYRKRGVTKESSPLLASVRNGSNVRCCLGKSVAIGETLPRKVAYFPENVEIRLVLRHSFPEVSAKREKAFPCR